MVTGYIRGALVIYLDNNATTRVDPAVFEAMRPFLTEQWGNPSSAYRFGKGLGPALDRARQQAAELVGADPGEIVFTSCGTESINTAVSSALAANPTRRHLVTTVVEHSATLKICRGWASRGFELTLLPVDAEGQLDLNRVSDAIRSDTALVSVMWVNNETGILFPVETIATLCRERGVPFHTDAVQAPGKVPIDARRAGVDYLSVSGHKFRAPKGVGFLYIRQGSSFEPLVQGGGQEHRRRGGTENVAGIVGLGCAAELAVRHLEDMNTRVRGLRDRLEGGVLDRIPRTRVNGSGEPRAPNTTNLVFEGVEGEALLLALDNAGICVSTGSACAAGSLEPSHVLAAMGRTPAEARGSIRFSLGLDTTVEEVGQVLEQVQQHAARLRAEMLPRV